MKFFHNPRCQKSREALSLLDANGIHPEVFLYLEEKITKSMLKDTLKKLGYKAKQLVRKSESLYKEEYKDKSFNNEQWIDILVKNPKLIERPIFINNAKAVVGRPPEKVLEIL